MITPFTPRMSPSRTPARISGSAAKKTIFPSIWRREAPNDRPISSSDGFTWVTPTWVSSAMTHTLNRKTVTIAYLSTLVELRPGDLIMTGTPAGVGRVVAGDVLEGEIEGVGALRVEYAR